MPASISEIYDFVTPSFAAKSFCDKSWKTRSSRKASFNTVTSSNAFQGNKAGWRQFLSSKLSITFAISRATAITNRAVQGLHNTRNT
ncbi:hypothetical protein SAMN02982917_0193 [Azospirillum oryzae]|uniref:Uncharacterized protein n=1 Tax=Azospirillum oryzae TaxID=286727 RepID=A0A1X7HQV8_9PROT|nr:hypothetical protein SAMN02982917_0193 [Azospirillum oryzae]